MIRGTHRVGRAHSSLLGWAVHRISPSNCRYFGNPVKETLLDVFVVNSAGRFTRRSLGVKDLKLETPGLHARDVVSLGILLDSKYRKKKIPRHGQKSFINTLKVREKFVLAALGNVRIILKPTELIIFDPHLPNVKSWVSHLSRLLQTNKDHFGLFVLEDLLRDTCSSFDRRLALYNSLLRSIQVEAREQQGRDDSGNILDYSLLSNMLKEETNAMHRRSESPISKLTPLQDLLFEFELELKDTRNCIMDVLNSTDHLARVNITAAHIGEEVSGEDDSAELIFETYGLRLTTTGSGLLHLQQRVKSQQTLADLNIRMKRNRILWLNVNLSAASLAIGFCGGCMASFGMNLPSGIEIFNFAFYGVCASSVGVSAWVYYRLLKYMRGDFSKTVEANQLAERKFLENVFTDIDAVDIVLNTALREVSGRDHSAEDTNLLTKAEFAVMFAEAKGVDEVDKAEVDTIFGLLDINKDDMLYKHELDVALSEFLNEEIDEPHVKSIPVTDDNAEENKADVGKNDKEKENEENHNDYDDEDDEEEDEENPERNEEPGTKRKRKRKKEEEIAPPVGC